MEWRQLVTPHNAISSCRNHGRNTASICRNAILLRITWIVAQVHACHVYSFVSCIVKFNPIVFLEVFIYINLVTRSHFIDTHGRGSRFELRFFAYKGLISGLYVIRTHRDFIAKHKGFCRAERHVVVTAFCNQANELRVKEDV